MPAQSRRHGTGSQTRYIAFGNPHPAITELVRQDSLGELAVAVGGEPATVFEIPHAGDLAVSLLIQDSTAETGRTGRLGPTAFEEGQAIGGIDRGARSTPPIDPANLALKVLHGAPFQGIRGATRIPFQV